MILGCYAFLFVGSVLLFGTMNKIDPSPPTNPFVDVIPNLFGIIICIYFILRQGYLVLKNIIP